MRVRALVALGRPQEASTLLSELFVEQAADDSLMYLCPAGLGRHPEERHGIAGHENLRGKAS